MEQMLLRFLRPATTIVWGLILVVVAHYVASNASAKSSFVVRHLFVIALVSWVAAVVLAIRLHFRRSGERRSSFFG